MKSKRKHIAIVYEGEKTEKLLQEYSAKDFSEIYLFFDYDPQNNNLSQIYREIDILSELLETFDNETENGKLYLSYPMIESFREISSEGECYKAPYVPLAEVKDYKRHVSESLEFQDFRHITKDKWEVACRASVKRAHLIINSKDEIPTYHYFIHKLTQRHIYKAQLEKYVRLNNAVGVLNGVPLFLLEYFDESFWDNVVDRKVI